MVVVQAPQASSKRVQIGGVQVGVKANISPHWLAVFLSLTETSYRMWPLTTHHCTSTLSSITAYWNGDRRVRSLRQPGAYQRRDGATFMNRDINTPPIGSEAKVEGLPPNLRSPSRVISKLQSVHPLLTVTLAVSTRDPVCIEHCIDDSVMGTSNASRGRGTGIAAPALFINIFFTSSQPWLIFLRYMSYTFHSIFMYKYYCY